MSNILYPYTSNLDFSKHRLKNPDTSYYGLPREVKFCKRCVISNQRPSSDFEHKNDGKGKKKTITFNQDNICDACKVFQLKSKIDWEDREQQLIEICNKYRKKDGKYDCLIPGSGGKDSFMQAHLLKYKYGMHPLTCTWAPHIYTDWGWKNHQAWVHAGFDNILFTPNGKVHRLITRLAVENLFHPFQPFILGQKNLAPKIAAQYDIPLIFYGESESDYGNAIDESKTALRDWEYFSNSDPSKIYIGGAPLSQLDELGLKPVDWEPYLPINPEKLQEKNIQVHYLGYYEKWHPQGAYYYAVENGNFQSAPERTAGTYSTYNSIDDRIDDFHYHTTWIKFGIGRATYDASQEVRNGDLTRQEAVSLIHKYDGEFPSRWANEIFEYLSINPKEFPSACKAFEQSIFDKSYYHDLSNKFRSPHLWYLDDLNKWNLRFKVTDHEKLEEDNAAFNWSGNIKKDFNL